MCIPGLMNCIVTWRECVQAGIDIIGNALSGEEARMQAFEALSYLLEPIDNANGQSISAGLKNAICLVIHMLSNPYPLCAH